MSKLIGSISEELGSGVFPSSPGRKPVFWKDGRNVNFESGVAKSSLGQFNMFVPGEVATVTGIQGTSIVGLPTVFYGTPAKLWKWDATNDKEDLTKAGGYSGDAGDLWSFGRWGNHLLASNGVDPVQYYQNAGDFADLVGPSFTWAKLLYTTDQYALALNTSLGGNHIGWSDIDDVNVWTTLAANDAGEQEVRNLDSEIIAAKKLRDTLIAYTFNEMFAIQYIGRPFIFGIRFLLEGFGPVGKYAVAAQGGRHFGFGRRGIWVTDGVSYEFIQNPAVFEYVYKDPATRYNKALGHLVIAWHDQLQNQIVFYYPRESGMGFNDTGVAFNYVSKTWALYDYGRSAVDDSGVFPFAITGDRAGNIYQQSVIDAPPSTGDTGIVDLTQTTSLLEFGLGALGLGEGGLGGGMDGTG